MSKQRPYIRRETRNRIMMRDLCRCRECGRVAPPWWDGWQMGHERPYSKGGRTFNNISLICRPCNQRIGANHWEPKIRLQWWQVVIDWVLIAAYDWPTRDDFKAGGNN